MRLVVIGGTAAGLSAASRVRKYLPDADITVIERTGYVSYGSCGLPYYVSGVHEGYECEFGPEDLTDWLIFTPERRISPDDVYLLEL